MHCGEFSAANNIASRARTKTLFGRSTTYPVLLCPILSYSILSLSPFAMCAPFAFSTERQLNLVRLRALRKKADLMALVLVRLGWAALGVKTDKDLCLHLLPGSARVSGACKSGYASRIGIIMSFSLTFRPAPKSACIPRFFNWPRTSRLFSQVGLP